MKVIITSKTLAELHAILAKDLEDHIRRQETSILMRAGDFHEDGLDGALQLLDDARDAIDGQVAAALITALASIRET